MIPEPKIVLRLWRLFEATASGSLGIGGLILIVAMFLGAKAMGGCEAQVGGEVSPYKTIPFRLKPIDRCPQFHFLSGTTQ
jgi:hypothetical protein